MPHHIHVLEDYLSLTTPTFSVRRFSVDYRLRDRMHMWDRPLNDAGTSVTPEGAFVYFEDLD